MQFPIILACTYVQEASLTEALSIYNGVREADHELYAVWMIR